MLAENSTSSLQAFTVGHLHVSLQGILHVHGVYLCIRAYTLLFVMQMGPGLTCVLNFLLFHVITPLGEYASTGCLSKESGNMAKTLNLFIITFQIYDWSCGFKFRTSLPAQLGIKGQ